MSGKTTEIKDSGFAVGLAAPVLLDYTLILSLVFGGCCSNVWTYEQLLTMSPRLGSALTFSQMLFITLQSLPSFLVMKPYPSLKPRQVPLLQWFMQVSLVSAGSLLNNWAYAYNVPLTIAIVFRSAGLAVSMLFGITILRRKYSATQMASVLLVTAGAILATLSRPNSASQSTNANDDLFIYSIGIGMLLASLACSGLLGVLQERTYQKYGPCWQEGVFYTHFLSLPVFLFLISDVKQGFDSLSKTHPDASYAWIVLAGNLVTQLICVSGVNRLSSQVSSVSTNLVLTTRKAISLCISIAWFGSGWNMQLGLGAAMVFAGSLLFSLSSPKKEKEKMQ